MNFHCQTLLFLCRICAKLLSRRSRRQYSCRKHAEAIKGAFDVDVTTDQAELHPPDICERCRMITQRWKSLIRTGRLYRLSQKAVAWEHHESGSCFACKTHSKNVKGGRPAAKRAKILGRPKCNNAEALKRFLHSLAPPSFKRPPVLYPDLGLENNNSDELALLLCPVCEDIVDRPVNSPCQTLACLTCLIRQFSDLSPGADWICPNKNCETVLLGDNSQVNFSRSDGPFKRVHGLVETSLQLLKVHF